MKVLIACEFSGIIRDAFIRAGHNALSCDLLASESDYGQHLQCDVFDALKYEGPWDLVIAHPPCTYLSNSGSRWLHERKGRFRKMRAGAKFFMDIWNFPVDRMAIENPIIHKYAKRIIGMKQSQIIQPWQFGHKEMKPICLWLRGLPLLRETNRVGPPPENEEERKKWQKIFYATPGEDRGKERSVFYTGIADAMTNQWGSLKSPPSAYLHVLIRTK